MIRRTVGYALVDFEPVLARNKRLRMIDLQRIKMRAGLPADLEKITKAAGRDHRDARALALDQRVGGDRGAVAHPRDRGGIDAANRSHIRAGRRRSRAAGLSGVEGVLNSRMACTARVVGKEVRKRAADIDSNQPAHCAFPDRFIQ